MSNCKRLSFIMLSFYFNESEVTPASVEIHTPLYLFTIILMANFVHRQYMYIRDLVVDGHNSFFVCCN